MGLVVLVPVKNAGEFIIAPIEKRKRVVKKIIQRKVFTDLTKAAFILKSQFSEVVLSFTCLNIDIMKSKFNLDKRLMMSQVD